MLVIPARMTCLLLNVRCEKEFFLLLNYPARLASYGDSLGLRQGLSAQRTPGFTSYRMGRRFTQPAGYGIRRPLC